MYARRIEDEAFVIDMRRNAPAAERNGAHAAGLTLGAAMPAVRTNQRRQSMKTLLLASAACLALSLPAMAQDNHSGTSSYQKTAISTGEQTQRPSGSQLQAGNQGKSQTIEPYRLDKHEIRQIQMSLNKAGFSSGKVDGIWGEETKQALRNYQQQKQLPGDGQLNRQTLAQLGVKSQVSAQEHQTTGSASGKAANSSSPNVTNRGMEPHSQQQNSASQDSKQK